MSSTRPFFFASIFTLFTMGCGGSDPSSPDSIVDQNPEGTIEGSPFSLVTAEVRVDGDDLDVSLYGEELTACGFGFPSTGSIIFSVPRMEGEYPLRFDFSADSQTITFFEPPSNNIIATEGIIVVESLSDTEVTIGLSATAGDSSINGRFTTGLCATGG